MPLWWENIARRRGRDNATNGCGETSYVRRRHVFKDGTERRAELDEREMKRSVVERKRRAGSRTRSKVRSVSYLSQYLTRARHEKKGPVCKFGDGDGSYWDRWLITSPPTKGTHASGTVPPQRGFKKWQSHLMALSGLEYKVRVYTPKESDRAAKHMYAPELASVSEAEAVEDSADELSRRAAFFDAVRDFDSSSSCSRVPRIMMGYVDSPEPKSKTKTTMPDGILTTDRIFGETSRSDSEDTLSSPPVVPDVLDAPETPADALTLRFIEQVCVCVCS
jgi:hypothetical protein